MPNTQYPTPNTTQTVLPYIHDCLFAATQNTNTNISISIHAHAHAHDKLWMASQTELVNPIHDNIPNDHPFFPL